MGSAALLSMIQDQVSRPVLQSDNFFSADYAVTVTGSNQDGPEYTFWPSHATDWQTEAVFVVIETTALIKIVGETLDGTSTWILKPTNSDTAGIHKAQFQFQGYIESLSLKIPSTGNGGFDGVVKVRAFAVPDLDPDYVIGVT